METQQNFETYKEIYFDEKGEYPTKFEVRIFDRTYVTVGYPFDDLVNAVAYIDRELQSEKKGEGDFRGKSEVRKNVSQNSKIKDVNVYKVELYRFDGVLIESWDWE